MFMAMINNQQIWAVEEKKKKILDPYHCLVDKHNVSISPLCTHLIMHTSKLQLTFQKGY